MPMLRLLILHLRYIATQVIRIGKYVISSENTSTNVYNYSIQQLSYQFCEHCPNKSVKTVGTCFIKIPHNFLRVQLRAINTHLLTVLPPIHPVNTKGCTATELCSVLLLEGVFSKSSVHSLRFPKQLFFYFISDFPAKVQAELIFKNIDLFTLHSSYICVYTALSFTYPTNTAM